MLPKKDGHPESYALEDMISDLQARRNSLDQEDLEDPAELLKKRDRDLVLAAELGKALLERNQELTRQSEILTEEYSTKLEVSFYDSPFWYQPIIFSSYLIDRILNNTRSIICYLPYQFASWKINNIFDNHTIKIVYLMNLYRMINLFSFGKLIFMKSMVIESDTNCCSSKD